MTPARSTTGALVAKTGPARPLLELRGVSRVFGSDPPVEALRAVDLVVERGDSLAIVGPSGSGKTTLMNIIGCLDRQTSGTYLIDGLDVAALGEEGRAALRGSKIGFVFQTFHLLAHRSVVENVMLTEVYLGGQHAGRERRARDTLARVGLADRADFLPTKLSGGQQQRVAIARALMGEPSLLLCDEPTGNLDSVNTDSILDLFDELSAEGMTLLVVTHDDHVAARSARQVRMVDGRLTETRSSPARAGRNPPSRRPAEPALRARMSVRDLLGEASAGLLARPARVALTVLGTVIGVGALVATLGLSKTAANQIVGRFDEVAATDVTAAPSAPPGSPGAILFPFDAASRISRLNGVVAAGTLSDVDVRGALVRSVPINDPLGQTAIQLPFKAVSPGLWRAVRATLATGRLPDAGNSRRHDRVVVLGPNAAQRLNISRVDQQPAIYVDDRLYVVIGILADVQRQPSLLGAAIIPEGTARAEFGLAAPGSVQIETRVGAVELIAKQAPLAISPSAPELVKVTAPPDPRNLKGAIKNDLNVLFVLLGGVSLLVGAIGIANVTLVSVLERVGEIGLRRALGAARRHIAEQFLIESTAMGLLGGIVGVSGGIFVVIAVSASRTWTPVLDPWVPIAAPLLGGLIGLVSGTYPALRAAALEPVDALRAAQ